MNFTMQYYTLLIFELVPEETHTYMIPNEMADKYASFLKEAHNKFINADDMNDGMRFLNTALSDEYPEEGFEEYLGVLRPYKQDIQSQSIDFDPDLGVCVLLVSTYRGLWYLFQREKTTIPQEMIMDQNKKGFARLDKETLCAISYKGGKNNVNRHRFNKGEEARINGSKGGKIAQARRQQKAS
jgi:hypothetical protein